MVSKLAKVLISLDVVSIFLIAVTMDVVMAATFSTADASMDVPVVVAAVSISVFIESLLVRSTVPDESVNNAAKLSSAASLLAELAEPPVVDATTDRTLLICAAAAKLAGFFTFK
jgi:hypothetical protein